MRACLCFLALVCSLAAAEGIKSEPLRGKLIVRAGEAPAAVTPDHGRVVLDGDE